MYLNLSPQLLRKLYGNSLYWEFPVSEKKLFLTFDDGPVPEATVPVLELLKKYKARATFFCVGDNIKKYPEVFQQVVADGHRVGNHTFHHLNAWKTDTKIYLENVKQCKEYVESNLFRPPYGRITPKITKALSQEYKIIMWTILAGDFDKNLSAEQCLNIILKHARPGSIIVLHDSLKTLDKIPYVLPRVLDYFSSKQFTFDIID